MDLTNKRFYGFYDHEMNWHDKNMWVIGLNNTRRYISIFKAQSYLKSVNCSKYLQ